jgi:hypothetical protein
VFLSVSSRARVQRYSTRVLGHSTTLRRAQAVSLVKGLEGLSHRGSTRFKTHNRSASAAIAGGLLQVAVSKARKPTCFVSTSCIIALPIQH